MSRFNPYQDAALFERIEAPALLRLRVPTLISALAGLGILTALTLAGLLGLALFAPQQTLAPDPIITGTIAVLVAVLLLSPLAHDGVSVTGVMGRTALAFAMVGLLASLWVATLSWWQTGLHSSLRLAAVWADALPVIGLSVAAHVAVGLIAGPLAAVCVCRLSR